MSVRQLLKSIKRGKEGKNVGIFTGIPKLDSVTYGIQRQCLYTIGADSGAGKTSFAIDVFLYNLIKNREDTSVDILYYSFEMSSDALYAKLLSLYIWDTFHRIITYETILSFTKPISDEDYKYVMESMSWLEEFQKMCQNTKASTKIPLASSIIPKELQSEQRNRLLGEVLVLS
jgi:replicative DNA helicase